MAIWGWKQRALSFKLATSDLGATGAPKLVNAGKLQIEEDMEGKSRLNASEVSMDSERYI